MPKSSDQKKKKQFCHSCTVNHTMDRNQKCFACHRQFSRASETRGDDALLVSGLKVDNWRIKWCPTCKCTVHRDQNAVWAFLRMLHDIIVTGHRVYPFMHHDKASDD